CSSRPERLRQFGNATAPNCGTRRSATAGGRRPRRTGPDHSVPGRSSSGSRALRHGATGTARADHRGHGPTTTRMWAHALLLAPARSRSHLLAGHLPRSRAEAMVRGGTGLRVRPLPWSAWTAPADTTTWRERHRRPFTAARRLP